PVRAAVLLSVPTPRRLYRAGECLHFFSCFYFTSFPLSSPHCLAADADFALYSCDSPTDAAAQADGAEAAADRCGAGGDSRDYYEIRGPLGWVDYVFSKGEIGNLKTDYVLGTDRTVRVEHYSSYAIDDFRKKLEAAGITVTDSYSASKAGKQCWVEFNLKEITEFRLRYQKY
uniref:hypothetical protein n=1 Tax=Treponema endosymbiont of Eucomonympha sp. TaxID=1580831 RepID=UPI001E3D4435